MWRLKFQTDANSKWVNPHFILQPIALSSSFTFKHRIQSPLRTCYLLYKSRAANFQELSTWWARKLFSLFLSHPNHNEQQPWAAPASINSQTLPYTRPIKSCLTFPIFRFRFVNRYHNYLVFPELLIHYFPSLSKFH